MRTWFLLFLSAFHPEELDRIKRDLKDNTHVVNQEDVILDNPKRTNYDDYKEEDRKAVYKPKQDLHVIYKKTLELIIWFIDQVIVEGYRMTISKKLIEPWKLSYQLLLHHISTKPQLNSLEIMEAMFNFFLLITTDLCWDADLLSSLLPLIWHSRHFFFKKATMT